MKRTNLNLFFVLTAVLIFLTSCATAKPKMVIEDEYEIANDIASDLAKLHNDLDGNLKVEEITGANNNRSSVKNANEKNYSDIKLISSDVKNDYYDFKTYVEKRLNYQDSRIGGTEEAIADHEKRLNWLDRKIAEANENVDLNIVEGYYIWLPEFDTNKYKINSEQAEILNDFIKKINSGDFIIGEKIDASADSRGTDEYNLRLSQKRAEATAEYLFNKLGSEKIVPWKPGTAWKNYFIAKGHGKTEKYGELKYNRRVRLIKLIKN